MNDWQVVIPHICPPENLAGCLASMGGIPVPLLLVDNSPDGHTETMDLPSGIEVVYHPQNLGVAASWNLGLRRGARWTLLCSASIRFEEDGLGGLLERASEVAGPYMLIPSNKDKGKGTLGWHIMIIGRGTVETIGYFDENFYPAYYEDNDYGWRMVLAGLPYLYYGKGEPIGKPPHLLVTETVCIGDNIAGQCMNRDKYDWTASGRYFREKWGAHPPEELWTHPFNDETKGLDWWPKKTRTR